MNMYSPSGQFGERMAAIMGANEPTSVLTQKVGNERFAATLLHPHCPPSRRLRLSPERAYLVSVDLSQGQIVIQDLRAAPEPYYAASLVQLYVPCAALERHAMQTRCSFSGLAALGRPLDEPVILHLVQCLLPLFEQAPNGTQLVESLALALYTRLITAHGASPQDQTLRGGLAPWQRKRAQQLLASDLTRPLRLADVARRCDLSISHFSRAFRHTEGVSPHQWVIRQRVDRARALLEEGDQPLAEIAIDCGFADQSHFTRAFSRLTGMPPGLWRRSTRAA